MGPMPSDFHIESLGALRNFTSDTPEPDDPELLAADRMGALETIVGPFVRLGESIRCGKLPCHRKHQQQSHFRDAQIVGARRIGERDAACPAGIEIDHFVPDTEAADNLEIGQSPDEVGA